MLRARNFLRNSFCLGSIKCLLVAALLPPALSARAETQLPFAESVLVDKSARKMWLITQGKRYREYDIALGDSPSGHKEQEGDERTPEGLYVIDYRNPDSRFHLSLHINYPGVQDQENARTRGVSPGGDIFIHGLPNKTIVPEAYRGVDWTDGCIAVNNREIEEIWTLVKDGTPIEILH